MALNRDYSFYATLVQHLKQYRKLGGRGAGERGGGCLCVRVYVCVRGGVMVECVRVCVNDSNANSNNL